MKIARHICVILIFIPCFLCHAQNKKVKALLNEIEGKWGVNENTGNVTYTKVFDIVGKDKAELFKLADDFVLELYDDPKSAIVSRDLESGRIVTQGWFKDVYQGFILAIIYKTSIKNLLIIDIKDNNASISITLTRVEQVPKNDGNSDYELKYFYPLNPRGIYKNYFGKVFYNAHNASISLIDYFEKTINK